MSRGAGLGGGGGSGEQGAGRDPKETLGDGGSTCHRVRACWEGHVGTTDQTLHVGPREGRDGLRGASGVLPLKLGHPPPITHCRAAAGRS